MTTQTNSTKTVSAETAAPLSKEAAAWRIVVAEYERTAAERERAGEAYNMAEAAYFCEAPDLEPFEEGYKLRPVMNTRERTLAALFAICARESTAGAWAATDEQLRAYNVEADRVVAEYEAALAGRAAVKLQHRVEEFDAEATRTAEVFWAVRRKMLATPAPDAEAMLFKLNLLGADMAENCADDADAVAVIYHDARRLFGKAE